ncbi:GNAT family N-acetyltransferase [Thalassotalea fusca]
MISLRDVNKDNYEAICDLDVTEEQQAYVACNMWSLVESFYNEGYITRGIYQENIPVGFLMWVYETPTKVSIWRFMIDQAFQNNGCGRKALALAIEEITTDKNLKEIEICYNPNNPVAKTFYSSFGFVEVGMDEDNEDMLAIIKL